MRHSNASIPLRLVFGLAFVGCVDTNDGSDSGQPVTGVTGVTTATASTDGVDSTGAPEGTDGPCTAPHDSSTGTSGPASTDGDETGGSEPGETGGEDGGTSDSGDGETGGAETGGAETGGPGETGESTGGSTGGSGETGDTGSTGDTGDMGGSTGGGDGVGPSFASEVWPIFDDGCGCHKDSNGAGKLKLAQDVAYDALVNKASSQLPTMKLVEPGSSETSYLWHKLANTHKSVGGKGKVMPPGGKLGMSELDLVKQWIDTGAAP